MKNCCLLRPLIFCLLVMLASGCDSDDARLIKLSQEAAARQAEQNDQKARRAITAGESVERLRNWAAGRCLAADKPGVYCRGSAGPVKPDRRVSRDPSNN